MTEARPNESAAPHMSLCACWLRPRWIRAKGSVSSMLESAEYDAVSAACAPWQLEVAAAALAALVAEEGPLAATGKRDGMLVFRISLL